MVLLVAACRAQQSADAVNDASRAVSDAGTPTPVVSTASVGDARLQCADAAKEQRFLEAHESCSVDDDCTIASTWLYPCGMPIQKTAVPDLKATDHSVSMACTTLGFHAPERDCTHAVLRAGCARGSCSNVVPTPRRRTMTRVNAGRFGIRERR